MNKGGITIKKHAEFCFSYLVKVTYSTMLEFTTYTFIYLAQKVRTLVFGG